MPNDNPIMVKAKFDDGTRVSFPMLVDSERPIRMDIIEDAAKGRWRAGLMTRILEVLFPGWPASSENVTLNQLTEARDASKTVLTPNITEFEISPRDSKYIREVITHD
jgi:hypothetical protein